LKTVLLVEDDVDLLALLRYNLEKEGYRVVSAQRGNYAGSVAEGEVLDLVLFDTEAAGSDGLDECVALRARPELCQIPFAILVGSPSDITRFGGRQLDIGDYIVKPFFVRDLIACIRRQLQLRAEPVGELRSGSLELDRSAGKVTVDGIARPVTATELRLLEFLMARPGVVFTREQLLFLVWGQASSVTAGNVTAVIMNLRKKLEHNRASPVLIRSVRGFGYSFNEIAGGPSEGEGELEAISPILSCALSPDECGAPGRSAHPDFTLPKP